MLKKGVFPCFVFGFLVLYTKAQNSTTPTGTTITDMKALSHNAWCKFQPNTFDCNGGKASISRFYYDIKMEDCLSFEYGSCPTKYNNFISLANCQESCRDAGHHPIEQAITANVACRLQPDFGQCHDYFPMWYYDIGERVCRGFSYSGCGGNKNRFPTSQSCIATCSKAVEF